MIITVIEGNARYELPFEPGETILSAMQRGGIQSAHAPCGGKGICKKCNVYVRNEDYCGTCLSCTTAAVDGMTVEVAPEVRLSFAEDAFTPVYPPDPGQTGYAVACDVGTVTIVCHLIRLETGECVAAVSGSNSQSMFGANVLSRLQSAAEGNAGKLSDLLIYQINGYIMTMCREAFILTKDIKMISIAGNSIMEHFAAGLDPSSRCIAPFEPVSSFGEVLDARSLGFCFDGGAYFCPCVSGFVGGDIAAGMLSAGLTEAEKPVLFADLGANSEIVIGCGDRFAACTADAGAAFKASLLDKGMTASAGAIDGAKFEDGVLSLHVLGDVPPVGVCGSGLIDVLGIMIRTGALTEMGRIADPDDADPSVAPMIGEVDGKSVFFLTENKKVYITQGDISKFQLAKAAISAGIQVLLEELGLETDDISRVCLAGGFGAFVRPDSAAAIGLIPSDLLARAEMLGNTSGAGAMNAAVSNAAREKLSTLCSHVKYIDLPTHPSFGDAYVDGLMFE